MLNVHTVLEHLTTWATPYGLPNFTHLIDGLVISNDKQQASVSIYFEPTNEPFVFTVVDGGHVTDLNNFIDKFQLTSLNPPLEDQIQTLKGLSNDR